MNYNTTKFINDLKAIGIELSDEQLEQFLTYYEMLIEKNKVMNLTAITDFDEVLEKHFELVQVFRESHLRLLFQIFRLHLQIL